ncbi:ipt tig domain outer membrane autotransporter barrel domain-containing protein : Outer membrane autotransporter barrel domain protein OS=Sphingomonas sp. S17 GN=SUS17_582 PE=4 SV=1 [Gemmataceae bacterium]|nr:ipt tig domain outer membrane autotransporter barrel domain-containing protein : Outer membrane autotransporter barrel domain protein OS=Sphingomonas sp. S17 GN=SUS17_582 PE=4 SV=1 [Gemmataceae bacterium]VTU02700.1 ipt tig domain outer membrane autotransporter barrel domain-containing protein : Outer membrane autotransporter barrel domain protein OS=Sphingomonas sp. S17 GN=SUS17_582 PE=4 SV=1 [Gemmataceae bacterium]
MRHSVKRWIQSVQASFRSRPAQPGRGPRGTTGPSPLRLEPLEARTAFSVTAVDTGSELLISTDNSDTLRISAAAGVLSVSSTSGLVNGNAAAGGVSTATFDLDDFTSINVLSENATPLRFQNVEVVGSAAFANEFLSVLANQIDFTTGPLSVNGLSVATAVLGATVTIDHAITSTGDVNLTPLGASVEVLAPIDAAGKSVTLVAGTLVPSGFTVTQTSAGVITAAALDAHGAGGVNLSQAVNVVGTVAGRASSGDFRFANANNLSVGTVNGVAGIATGNGNVSLSVATGKSITVGGAVTAGGTGKTLTLAADVFDLDAANAVTADNVVLATVGSGANLTLGGAGLADAELNAIAATNLTVQASGTLTTSGALALGDDVSQSIALRADAMALDAGTINAGTRTVALLPYTTGTQILLGGADATGILGLTNTELGNTTAGTLQIGNATSGAITVAGAVAAANVSTLRLTTGANVVDSNTSGTDITVANLGITAGTGVATSANPLETAVSSLTATTTAGGIFVTDTGALSLGETTAPGSIEVTTSGTLTVASQVASAAGNVTLTATGVGSNVSYGGAGFSNALAGTVTVNAGGAITHAGSGDDIRASAVVLHAVSGIGTSAAPLEMSTASVTASNTTSGDVVLRLNANAGFSTTTASVNNAAATGDVTVTRNGGTQLTVTSATTTNGSVTLSTNGAGLSLTGVSTGGANRDVTATTTGTGNITVGGVAAARLVSLTAGGAIADDGVGSTAVTAPSLALAASTGIGASGTPINTDADKLEATTGTGGIFIGNAGALAVGGVSGALAGVRVTGASGAIAVSVTGTITINEGVRAPGNVTLTATGSASDIVTQGGGGNEVASSGGTTTLRADRNLTLGTSNAYGDVRGQGLVLEADGNIVLDNQTYAQADGPGGITVTAGGDVKILKAIAGGSVLNSNGGGAPVSVNVGAGRTFVLDQGSNGGVGANGGNIAINADNMDLASGSIGTTAAVTLAPVTFLREINLGTVVTDALSLTDAELDLVAAGTLVIGSSAPSVGAARIIVSADLTRPTATNLELVSGNVVQNSGGGSINTAGGSLALTGVTSPSYTAGRTGTDLTASAVSFDSGRTLLFTLGGTTPDTGYTRLTVAGTVNLAGTDLGLVVPGSIVPSTGDVFTIVSATSRTGMFNGYGENSTVLFRGVTLRVNYTATTVTLTAIGAPTANAQSVTVGQGGANFPITLTASDPNTPALPLTYTVTDPPDHGTLSGSGANLMYTPDAGYSGPDSFAFTVTNGVLDSTAATVSITVAEAPTVTDVTPAAWTVNRAGYTGSLAITGGSPAFAVTAQAGLPPGLTAVVNGAGTAIVFTGTPTTEGVFKGSVTLTDANGAVVTKTVEITITAPPALSNLTTTAWTATRAGFTGTMTLSGGTPVHAITGQTGLPPGLTAVLTGGTVRFTGTPSVAGTFTGSVTVTDGSGAQVTKSFTIVVNAVPRFVLAAGPLPKYTVGSAYNRAITVAGGTGPLRVAVVAVSAPLPTGMRLAVSGSQFVLSGTPRAIRSPIRITLRVTDALGVQATVVYTLTGQLSPVRRGL